MTPTLHTNETAVNSFPFPFEELLSRLQQEGFAIRPDDYIELLKISAAFTGSSIRSLKYRLAPLIVTSPQEQERFYQVFDEYAANVEHKDEGVEKVRKKRIWLWSIIGITLLVLLLIIYLVKDDVNKKQAPPARFEMLVNGKPANFALLTDTIQVDASAIRNTVLYDTSGVHFSWDIGRGWEKVDEEKFSLIPEKPGPYNVRLQVYGDGENTINDEYAQTVFICKTIVAELEHSDLNNIKVGSELTISPVILGEPVNRSTGIWIINRTDTIRNQPDELRYPVRAFGQYHIEYALDLLSANCHTYTPVEFSIEKPSPLETAAIPSPLLAPTFINPWLYLLLLLPLSGILLHYFREQQKRKKILRGREALTEEGTIPAGPVDIPLEDKALDLITREQQMNTLFRGMRKKIEDEGQVLNVPKSIRSEILSAGVPTLVYSQRMRPQEFLLLIDRTMKGSPQVALFKYLVNVFEEENIIIDRFYFTQFDLFYNIEHAEGLTLQRLSELYKNHVLIVMGTGYQLLYEHLPVLEEEKMKLLEDWEIKAIITPQSFGDWGPKESALRKEFNVLPADIQGQILLIQAIGESQFNYDSFLESEVNEYRVGTGRMLKIEQLRSYLQNEFLFQWLCAMAVYPKLRWEIMIEIGKSMAEAAGDPGLVNYSNLLKLVRIPWMNHGFIPESTRLELLKQLNRDNEVIARQTVLRVLQYAQGKYKGEYFFSEEKEMQQLTNAFVLHEHDSANYKQFEQQANEFKSRWAQGKVHDGPLIRYLDKQKGDKWQNLLNESTRTKLGGYHGDGKQQGKALPKVYIAWGIVTIVLASILFFGKSLLEKTPLKGMLVLTDSSARQLLHFNFMLDTCTVDSAAFTSGMNGNVILQEEELALQFSAWNKATLSVPFNRVVNKEVDIALSWDNNRQSASTKLVLSPSNELRIRSCILPVRPLLQIAYNDAVKQDSIRVFAQALSARYEVEELLDTSIRASSFWISDSSQAGSDSIRALIKGYFNQEVMPSGSARAANARINLFFRKVAGWTAMPINALPVSLNDIWRGAQNKRLLTILLPERLMWYSIGDPKNFGTYALIIAYQKEKTYKLVFSGTNVYRVAFLENITPNAFDFCLLPTSFANVEQTQRIDLTYCTNRETMNLYYKGNPTVNPDAINRTATANISLYYFPLRPSLPLNNIQVNKLKSMERLLMNNYTVSVFYFRNRFFDKYAATRVTPDIRVTSTKQLFTIPLTTTNSDSRIREYSGTPFDRDYANVNWNRIVLDDPYQQNIPNQQQQVKQDPCDITFSDLDDALKEARTVCRLNLSNKNLSSIDEKVFGQFTALQYLDVRNNQLQPTDSVLLSRILPKCEILFTPQRTPPSAQKQQWRFITRLEVEAKKFTIRQLDEQLFMDLGRQLYSSSYAKLKIVGYYQSASDRKEAEAMVYSVAQQLGKYGISNRLGNDKFSTLVVPYTGDEIKRVIEISYQKASDPYVDLYGIELSMPASAN